MNSSRKDCRNESIVVSKKMYESLFLDTRPAELCADLSIRPSSDKLHNPISIQVKGMDAHCMILGLGGEKKTPY